ncbi:hypothetical protein HYT56_01610 [Candidatus Woesearchaeota archaeon]|nr:hypothetical protein [Candidatus Woesearchaeota archaeon]
MGTIVRRINGGKMGTYGNRPESDIDISGRGGEIYYVRAIGDVRPKQFRNPTELTDYVEKIMGNFHLSENSFVRVYFDPRLKDGMKSQVKNGLRKKRLDGFIKYLS